MLGVYIAIAVLVLIPLLWCLMIKPGKRHSLTKSISGYSYAHRGLHDSLKGIPENSVAAFYCALKGNYGIELDVHLTASATPVVIHDRSLLRTAGTAVDIDTLEDSDIKGYRLEHTRETIPFFSEVLEVIGGRVPLLIELKVDGDNYPRLCDEVMKRLEGYDGIFAIQSFDPRALRYLKKNYPDVMRGQLSGFLRKSGDKLHRFLDFGLRNLLTNFITKPNFIAYRVQDNDRPSIKLCRLLYSPLEFNWTLKKKKHFKMAKKYKAIPIFEKYMPKKTV